MPLIPLPGGAQVDARPMPAAYSNVNLNTGAEQVGRAVEGLGNAITGAGLEELQRQNMAQVQQQYSKTGEWQQKNVWDPKTGALARQGKDAEGVTASTVGSFDEYTKGLEQELTFPAQRRAFQALARQERESVQRTLSRHEAQQREVVEEASHKAALDTAASNGANAYNDPDTRDANYAVGESAVRARAAAKGWDAATEKAALRDWATRFHLDVIERIKDADPAAAEAYLKEHAAEIDGETRANKRIDEVLSGGLAKNASRSEAERLQRQAPGNLSKQLELAKGIKDTRVYDATVARLKEDDQTRHALIDRADEQNIGFLKLELAKSKGVLDTNSPYYIRLSPKAKGAIAEHADMLQRSSTAATTEQRRVQAEVNKVALNQFDALDDNAAVAVNLNDANEFPGADAATRAALVAKQRKAQERITKGISPDRSQFKTMVEERAKTNFPEKEQEELRTKSVTNLMVWWDNEVAKNDGRLPERKAVLSQLGEMYSQGVVEGKMFDSTKYGFQLQPGEQLKKFGRDKQTDEGARLTAPAEDQQPHGALVRGMLNSVGLGDRKKPEAAAAAAPATRRVTEAAAIPAPARAKLLRQYRDKVQDPDAVPTDAELLRAYNHAVEKGLL